MSDIELPALPEPTIWAFPLKEEANSRLKGATWLGSIDQGVAEIVAKDEDSAAQDFYTADQLRAAILADREKRAQAARPHAYAVYFPDQQREELVHDLDELLDDLTNYEHTVTPLFATEASKPVQAEAPTASNAELEASYTATTLAAMILSDCGHSTENTRLLERVAKRIDKYADTIGDARAALATQPTASNAGEREAIGSRDLANIGRKYFGEAVPPAWYAAAYELLSVDALAQVPEQVAYTYASTQATNCAGCGERKHTPLRVDAMGGYVCLTCIDRKLGTLLGEFGYPEVPEQVAGDSEDAKRYRLVRRGQHWSVIDGIGNTLRGEQLDKAVDDVIAINAMRGAARTSGEAAK